MKYLLSLALIGLSSVVWSQGATYEISEFSGDFISERVNQSDDNLRVEDVIWQETFANGIPTDWTNENYDENNNLTAAVWEYRGPDTTPSSAIGSRGSCEESGTGEGVPIISDTASDGFIIFDSDYWDSSEGDCVESLGTGISPSPHHASLTTSSFDFTNEPYVGLTFTQYLKNFNAAFKVQVSVDGGEFQDIYVSDITSTNFSSPRDMKVRKNISEVAGNQSDVRIRFYFEQMYYFWMIDDCSLVALEENNLEVINANHSSFFSNSATLIESFEGLDYFKYPTQMPPVLNPNVDVENRGGLGQTGCALDVTVYEGATLLESMSSAAVDLASEQAYSFTTATINVPNAVADYDITYAVTQAEEDNSPENNTVSRVISVTESTLARDAGTTEAYFEASAELSDQAYEVGTVYQPDVSGLELHSISTALGSGTNTAVTVYAALYGIDLETGLILEPIAQTDINYIYPYELNEIGDEQIKVLEFDSPITLYEDSSYLAVIGTSHAAEHVQFCFSGDSYPYTSWAKFADNTVFFLDKTPMVRMNFGEITAVAEEPETNVIGAIFPNPASDKVTIEYNFENPSELAIGLFDINGRLIENLFAGKNDAGTHQIQVDVSTIPSGTYLIRLLSEYGRFEETLIIE